MNLADFIDGDVDGLMDDWADYDRANCPTDGRLQESQLRNSVGDILSRIAVEMRSAQDAPALQGKYLATASDSWSSFDQAAHRHVKDRLSRGFDINRVVAEFRALRAIVLRRWQRNAAAASDSFCDMIRFNEAIDQVLTEAVRRHAYETSRARDLLTGALAHDLRSPLSAVLNSAILLLHENDHSENELRAIANIQRGAGRMRLMIDDLLAFSGTHLHQNFPICPTVQDLGHICSGAIDEVSASYPGARIDLRLDGDLQGRWDGGRLRQLASNLLVNAIRYGEGGVTVDAAGYDEQMTIKVANEGNPIPAHSLPTLFDPLTRVQAAEHNNATGGMGLGLYICRCIVTAHGGTIDVESMQSETRFTVRIPRIVSPPVH